MIKALKSGLQQMAIAGKKIPSLKNNLVSGVLWTLVSKMVFPLSGVVLNMLLVRLLPPSDVGNFFLLVNLISILGVISSVGLNMAVVKIIAESFAVGSINRARKSAQLALSIGTVGSLLAGLIIIVGEARINRIFFDFPLISGLSVLIASWLLFSNLQSICGEIFRGMKNLRAAAFYGGQGLLARIFFLLILSFTFLFSLEIELHDLIIFLLISNVVTFLAAFVQLSPILFFQASDNSSFDARDLLSLIGPMWITSLGTLVLSQVDITFTGILLPENEVALYGVANRISYLVSTPLLIMNSVLMPHVTEQYKLGKTKQVETLLQRSAALLAIPAIGSFLLLMLFGGTILRVLFGEYYTQAYWPTIILSFSQLINVITGSSGLLMNMSGYHKQFMWIALGTGLINLLLYAWAIGSYGIMGGAMVNASGRIVISLIVMTYVYIKTNIKTWPGK